MSDQFPGSGGLSLRRVSTLRQVLFFQDRQDDGDPEDRWFVGRIGTLPDAKIPSTDVEARFCVQDVYHENPLGYHISSGGTNPHPAVWGTLEQRKLIFNWCPEVKMILDMKFERERCTEDDANKISEEEQMKQDEEQKKAEEESAKQAEERKKLEEEIKAAVKAELKQETEEKKHIEGDDEVDGEGAAEASEKAAVSSTTTAQGGEASADLEVPAEEESQPSVEQVGEGPFTHRT